VAGGYQNSNAYAFEDRCDRRTVEFVLSFEGTNGGQPADWTSTNLLEYGWSNYYASLMPVMTELVRQAMVEKFTNHRNVDITFTGHSLGGAAASVAFADLFLASGQDFWVEAHAPLKSGSRIYDQTSLDAWTDEEIHTLVDDSSVYTFGAPSFLIDPTKPDSTYWSNITLDWDSGLGGKIEVVSSLLRDAPDALTVDPGLIPENLTGFQDHVFQFEHQDADFPVIHYDPVAWLGSIDAGTVLTIDLSEASHNRRKVSIRFCQCTRWIIIWRASRGY
jgi:hypothetical protein